MKYVLSTVMFASVIWGVFSADEDEKMSVEGESVTLIPDLTQIQGINEKQWTFTKKGSTTAEVIEDVEILKDRCKTDDQTGSLTISNTRTNHSGLYILQIDHNKGTTLIRFTITVSEVPPVIEAHKAETKSISVVEGNPVTLYTDITKLHGDELIVFRFGDEGKLLAKEDKETKSSPYYDTDERFKGRLKLNDQTGSLTIEKMKNTDAGLYTVKISSNKQILYKKFVVNVTSSSSAAVAGTVVGLLLLFAVVAGLGFLYYRHKISELQKLLAEGNIYQTAEGEDVTIKTGTKLRKGDVTQWSFDNDNLIALSTGKIRETYDGPGRIFKDTLELDEETGSLTIKNIRRDHIGEYILEIVSSRGEITKKTFIVDIKVKRMRVEEEDKFVTLKPDIEIQRDDEIEWFGDQDVLIAEMNGETREITYPDESFRDTLQLDNKTGSLTIKSIAIKQSRHFKVKISSSSRTKIQKFRLYLPKGLMIFNVGESAVLSSVAAEIQKDDHLEWVFKTYDSPIAEIKDGKFLLHAGPDERFKDKLELNKKTGSLTIKNGGPEHNGLYYMKNKKNERATIRSVNVVFRYPDENRVNESVNEGSPMLHAVRFDT